MSATDTSFAFSVAGRPGDLFSVIGFTGEEALSALYRFDVTLCAESPDLDPTSLLGQAATLTLSTFGQSRDIHGLVVEAEYLRDEEGIGSVYRALLMPRLWRLTESRRNRIFGPASPVSVVDILKDVLTAVGLVDDEQADPSTGGDYELDLNATYRSRRHTVQYEETDFAFVSRHLEAQGIFYLFESKNGKDVAVFADRSETFPDVDATPELAYRSSAGMVHDAPSISAFEIAVQSLPTKVVLKDYNYRLPNVAMRAEADVDPDAGVGTVMRYGDHFRSPEDGAALALIKADAFKCREVVAEAHSDCVWIAAGRLFVLEDHPSTAWSGCRYLVERVVHEGLDLRFQSARPAGLTLIGPHAAGYANSFTALDASLTYRPEERTPRPVMAGLMHARIDAAGDGARAELDEQGRYLARTAFDVSDAADGKATRHLRMMQPYGGTSQGMDFPLLKGTEVLLSAVNGDPDRPVILGAVPNRAQTSVVTNTNETQNVVQSATGVRLELEDGTVADSSGDDTLSSDTSVDTRTWAKLYVPSYGADGSGGAAYLRLGAADSVDESVPAAGLGGVLDDDYDTDGIFTYADGSDWRVTEGSRVHLAGGDATTVIDGDETDSVGGSRTVFVGYGDETAPGDDALTVLGSRDVTVSGDLGETVGGDRRRVVSGTAELHVSGSLTDVFDGNVTIHTNSDYNLTTDGQYSRKLYGDSTVYYQGSPSTFFIASYQFGLQEMYGGMRIGVSLDLDIGLYISLSGYADVVYVARIELNAGANIHLNVLTVMNQIQANLAAFKIEKGVLKAHTDVYQGKSFIVKVDKTSIWARAYGLIKR